MEKIPELNERLEELKNSILKSPEAINLIELK
jgi:hypothetical protein